MTALTKKMREEIKFGVLRKKFEASFKLLAETGQQEFDKVARELHPTFFKAIEDKALIPYLGVAINCAVQIQCEHVTDFNIPRFFDDGTTDIKRVYPSPNVKYPSSMQWHTLKGDEIVKYYSFTWDSYRKSKKLLTNTLAAYTTVEKLLNDFPEFEEFVSYSKTNLPAVIVKDARANLTSLGLIGSSK